VHPLSYSPAVCARDNHCWSDHVPCVDRNKLKDLKNAIAGLAVILVVVSLNKQSDRSVVCFAPRPFIERLMEKGQTIGIQSSMGCQRIQSNRGN